MFANAKRKIEPAGPFEFAHSVAIDKPADEIYALIDWADPRNAKRALGNKVERVGSGPERFRMTLDLIPGHRFEMTVTSAEPGDTYAFRTEISPSLGQLAASHETYTLEPLSETSCVLTLLVSASFSGGLTDEALAMELTMMAVACGNALEKLKVQAEQGAEAVHAIEAMQMDCGHD